jgi:outer membrane biosynthesis protein TonB
MTEAEAAADLLNALDRAEGLAATLTAEMASRALDEAVQADGVSEIDDGEITHVSAFQLPKTSPQKEAETPKTNPQEEKDKSPPEEKKDEPPRAEAEVQKDQENPEVKAEDSPSPPWQAEAA